MNHRTSVIHRCLDRCGRRVILILVAHLVVACGSKKVGRERRAYVIHWWSFCGAVVRKCIF
jgi:hypothetical protein